MKHFVLSIAALCISLTCAAQATLPTSFDFATAPATLPAGWSTNTTDSYTSGLADDNGSTTKAGKLQSTGHHFTIEFFDEPGTLTYNLRAYGTSSFAGTLVVEESVNGSTWSALHTFSDNDFDNQWNTFTETPAQSSRFIRFNLSNKVSGTNVGLDDVSIAAFAPVNAEINAVYNNLNVPSGTAISFGSALSTPLSLRIGIENLGSAGTLSIGTLGFSGVAASDYSVAAAPASVGPSASDTIVVNFIPSAAGTRMAQVSIANSDANEDPYIIQLNGIGGNLATEPSANASNLSTTTLKTYRIQASFAPSQADGYLVLFRKHQPFSDIPADGVQYEAGEGIGAAKVAHIGQAGSFAIREAQARTTYHVKVFAYNGSGTFINYRTSDPLTDSISTPATTMRAPGYYAGVDESNTSFVTDLHNVINPHAVRFYSNYGPDMVPRFLGRDTVNGQDVLTAVYSGFHVSFTPPLDWSSVNLNREHTFPASWMPTYGDDDTPEYQDFHHLFPELETANFQRSNHPLGKVVNVTNSYGQGKLGTDASGHTVYEPRDAHKGDAVRAMMYMQMAYHDPVGGDSWALDDLGSNAPDQDAGIYLQWHLDDLPGEFEMARNDYLDSLQQNRNPFIDSAHWVCYIDFRTMSHVSTPDSVCLAITKPQGPTGIAAAAPAPYGWMFYPNPVKDYLHVSNHGNTRFLVEIRDLTGKVIFVKEHFGEELLDLRKLSHGVYFIRLDDRQGVPEVFRLVKN